MDVSSILAMRPKALNWYVLRVMSGQEKKVKDYLEAEIKTWDQKGCSGANIGAIGARI